MDSFRGQLSDLKRESVSLAVRALVPTHASPNAEGEPNERFTTRCYDYRSKLVHGNPDAPAPSEITAAQGRLADIVSAVILSVADPSPGGET